MNKQQCLKHNCAFLFLILLCICSISVFILPNIIKQNETKRENYDRALLMDIKEMFSDTLKKQSAQEYVSKLFNSNGDDIYFRIGSNEKISYYAIKMTYPNLYSEIADFDTDNMKIRSRVGNKEGVEVYLVVSKDMNICVIMSEDKKTPVNCKYSDNLLRV